jgi:5-methylcytosine-specific restriction enzyme A
MPTYLLSWNPRSAFTWPNNGANSAATREGRVVHIRWSTGGTTGIVPGYRIFLGKLGRPPIGVIASGVAASQCFEDTHWEDDSKSTTYNMVDFDAILAPENVLPRSELLDGPLGRVNWDAEYGGVVMDEDAAEALEAKWRDWIGRAGFPRIEIQLERSVFQQFGFAGWTRLRLHLFLERDLKLCQAKRNEALRRSGCLECEVCGLVFTDASGDHGSGLFECHDRRALSTLDSTGDLDPGSNDLALVCANCHRMLHSQDWPSVEKLRFRLVKPDATPLDTSVR